MTQNFSSAAHKEAIHPFTATLRDRELEKSYRKFALVQGGNIDRLLMISGALIHLAYGMLDWMVLGDLAPVTIMMRAVSIPFLIALFFLTYTPWGYRNMMWITVAIVAIVTLSFSCIIHEIGSATPPYYVGLIQLAVQFSAVARLNFRVCSGLLLFMTGSLLVATWSFTTGPSLLAGQVMVVGILIGSAAGNYFLERNRRLEFMTYRDREHYFEQVREMAEEAERSVDRKNALLNALGHVVKTPLHQIIGYAQIIEQSETIPGAEEQNRNFAGEIFRAGTTLSLQSQRLLEFSRADAGLLPSEYQVTSALKLVNEAVYRHQNSISEKKLNFELNCNESQIKVDTRHLIRAIDELLDNAVRYCSPGSTIAVNSRSTVIGTIISIDDNGPGVTDQNFDIVGQTITQIDNVRKLGGDKLGIGISLAKSLTRIGGGELYFCSIPDNGSLAQIVIPHRHIASEYHTPDLRLAS